jgi:hypothetical protein
LPRAWLHGGGRLSVQIFRVVVVLLCLDIAGCARIVAKYDAFYSLTLNKFSEDTAKFLAAAEAGKQERLYTSKETVTFYAAGYNTFDRLSQRAALDRGMIRCFDQCPAQSLSGQHYQREPPARRLPIVRLPRIPAVCDAPPVRRP